MTAEPLRILILGAHPDDADIKAGGTAAKWSAMGHVVRLVSLTDGGAGHQSERGPGLARRRRAEAEAAAAIIGASSEVGGVPDGTLDDGIESRHRVIRLIRGFRPDLILTHRPTDYHPDHRFAGLLVQDAAYLLTVPAICPDSPHLAASPVVLDFSDAFRKPCRLENSAEEPPGESGSGTASWIGVGGSIPSMSSTRSMFLARADQDIHNFVRAMPISFAVIPRPISTRSVRSDHRKSRGGILRHRSFWFSFIHTGFY